MDKYIIQTKRSDADALSMKEAQSRGCDGVHTIFWFDVRETKDGQFAVVVPVGEEKNLDSKVLVDAVAFSDKADLLATVSVVDEKTEIELTPLNSESIEP